jgi:long-chain acyl-CoA synthetase
MPPSGREARMIPHTATTLNLATVLEYPARLTPDRPALVCGPTRLTYGQLDAMACQVAGGLRSIGIKPGDHVALSCPNVTWFPVAYFGILKAGAVVVPLNVLFKPREIAYHLRDSDAKALLVFEGTPELPMAEMARAACDVVSACDRMVVLTIDPKGPSPVEGALSVAQLVYGQAPEFATHGAQPDDTAVILYTSGTTGEPKGAELTHMNMLMNAMITAELFRGALGPNLDDVTTLITLPLFHSTGQTAQMNAELYAGARLVLLPRFDPAAVLETMQKEHVTCWTAVPTMYWSLLQHAAAADIDTAAIGKSLRLCASGGAPMPVAVMEQFAKTFGARILVGYGLSETAPVATFNHGQRPSKPGTVGQPIFGVEVACLDDDDRPVATGERGEVCIRGHNIMKGYYKRPDATADVMRNGWFHTGDIGTLDADGYLAIVDRKKDMILRGGFNVYPRELEEVLMTHPAVSLVAVVGVPDERLGEEVKAYIVRKPGAQVTEQDVIDWCREQIASYKYPRVVEFRESLPMGATGKILKRALRGEAQNAANV